MDDLETYCKVSSVDPCEDLLTILRRKAVLPYLVPGLSSLEVGAYYRPTLPQNVYKNRYVDFYNTEELRKEAEREGLDPTRVVEVDYVVRGEDYRDVIKDKFDVVVANHVLEHVSNPIKWLNMISELMEDRGILFVALPDKKFSFDRLRHNTSLAHLLTDFLVDTRSIGPEHVIEILMYYDNTILGGKNDIFNSLDLDALKGKMNSPWQGIHSHVFEGDNFLSTILKPLLFMKLIPYSLVNYVPHTQAGEFYVILRKGWTPIEFTSDEFYQAHLAR